MATALNLGSLTVDSSGRAFLAGTGSGIDFSDAVNKIIEAKRQPAVSLEAKVTANQAKIEAYKELRTTLNTFRDALSRLRGAVSVDGAGDVFRSKSTFTSTFRTDGQSPSAAGNLVGATVTNGAAKGVHEIEVRRIATAHKVASQSFASQGTALGVAGELTVGGRTVTVAAGDTLANIRDRINAVNSGSSASGVTASIVSVGSGENYLVLTKDQAGSAMTLADAGTLLADLGISADHGTSFQNQLQAAQTARFTADGLIDPDRFETAVQTSATANLATLFTPKNVTGSFTLGGTVVNYNANNDSLQDLADRITSQVPNATATVVADGLGFRLDVTTTDPSLTVADTSGLLGDLGFSNDLVIERSTNQVTDLFAGVTLSLFQAEAGTTIKIEVEQDLSLAKTAVADFVTAYNAVRRLVNEHSQADPTTGTKGPESGVLFADSTLGDIRARLATAVGSGVTGVTGAFSVLAQAGVSFVDNGSLADALDKNTLRIDDTKLNDALVNNPDDVRRLFAFDFASTSSNVAMVDYGANTTFTLGGYTLNVGTIGQKNKNSAAVVDADALLNSADSFAATTSGAFNVNGVAVVYDVATESLRNIADRINASVIPGVVATVKTGAGGPFLALSSANGPLTVDGDTGDLLALMDIQPDTSIVDSANIGGTADGADDGSVVINGRTLIVTNTGGATGLKLFYSGEASTAGIGIDVTQGLAADLFFDVDSFVNLTDGALQSAIAALEGENVVAEQRVDEIDARLDIQRASLTRRFVAMEVALQSLARIREQLEQYAAQLSGT